MGRYWLGVDIGGTFTDVVLLGRRRVAAHPQDALDAATTTPAASSTASSGCSARPACGPTRSTGIVHATTVASNAMLEGKGARTALITTEGFRDVLEMRRLRIPVLYDLQYEKPAPLVPRRLRFEVAERMGPRGEVWRRSTSAPRTRSPPPSRTAAAEAVAVSLLHAYANPAHEQRVAEIVRARCPAGRRLRHLLGRHPARDPRVRAHQHRASSTPTSGPVVRRYLELARRAARAGGRRRAAARSCSRAAA